MAEWQTKTIPLAHPIDDAGGSVSGPKITQVTLMELNADGLELIDDAGFVEGVKPRIGQLKIAIAAVTRLSPETVGQLHRDDFEKLVEEVVPFMESGQKRSPPETPPSNSSIPSSATSPTG